MHNKSAEFDSFDQLLTAHLGEMFALAYRLSGSKETAEDLVQDMFLNLKLRDVDVAHVTNPRAWLAAVLYRQFVDHWRREQRSQLRLVADIGELGEQSVAATQGHFQEERLDPAEQLRMTRKQQRVRKAVDRLDEKHRVLVVLHDFQGYTLGEIEDIMQVPVGTLKSRLSRAREKLFRMLSNKEW